MKYQSGRMIGAVVCALLFAMTARVAVAEDSEMVKTMTSAQMKALLADQGFTNVTIDEDDDLIVKMTGYNVLIFVRGNNYTFIKFRFAVAGTTATLSRVNDWNRKMNFTKSFLDEDDDPVLEMDLDLEGGVTIARIKDGIRTFSQALNHFLREVAY